MSALAISGPSVEISPGDLRSEVGSPGGRFQEFLEIHLFSQFRCFPGPVATFFIVKGQLEIKRGTSGEIFMQIAHMGPEMWHSEVEKNDSVSDGFKPTC